MSNNPTFDFVVDKTNHTITIQREFAAVRSLVWDCYTKAEILEKWWAPKPWKAKTKTMDFREGGHWHYAMVGPGGEEHWALATYITIELHKRFTGTDAFADVDANINKDMPQSTWDARFTDAGQHTLVRFHITYGDLAQLETTIQMGFKEGMSMAMENLDEVLAKMKK